MMTAGGREFQDAGSAQLKARPDAFPIIATTASVISNIVIS